MHRAGSAARFCCLLRPHIAGLSAGIAGLLACEQPASAQSLILSLLAPANSTLQQLGILNSTFQQLGVSDKPHAGLSRRKQRCRAAWNLEPAARPQPDQHSKNRGDDLGPGHRLPDQRRRQRRIPSSALGFYDAFAASGPGVYKAGRTKAAPEREWRAQNGCASALRVRLDHSGGIGAWHVGRLFPFAEHAGIVDDQATAFEPPGHELLHRGCE